MQKTVVRPRAAVDAARSSVPAGRPGVAAPKAPEAQTRLLGALPPSIAVELLECGTSPRLVLSFAHSARQWCRRRLPLGKVCSSMWMGFAPAAVLLLHLGAWHRVLELSLLRWLEIRTPGRPMSADSPLSRPCPARRPTAGTGSARSPEASFAATGKTSSSPVRLSDRRPSG